MKEFGILNEDLGVHDVQCVFEEERRSIGVKTLRDREWTESIGSGRQWWTSRYIKLTTKRVL